MFLSDMTKVNPRFLDSNDKKKYLDLLWTSIAGLKTREEVKNFFKDLLSESEAVMLARRLLIAKMLLEGKKYEEIVSELRVGDDTVAKVGQWLCSGFGGYEKAVKSFESALLQRREKIKKSEPPEPYSFEWLKRKYPLHFLLFNLFDRQLKTLSKKKKNI